MKNFHTENRSTTSGSNFSKVLNFGKVTPRGGRPVGSSPNTRAETFYRKAGWKEIGKRPNGEIHFEMSFEDWNKKYAV